MSLFGVKFYEAYRLLSSAKAILCVAEVGIKIGFFLLFFMGNIFIFGPPELEFRLKREKNTRVMLFIYSSRYLKKLRFLPLSPPPALPPTPSPPLTPSSLSSCVQRKKKNSFLGITKD